MTIDTAAEKWDDVQFSISTTVVLPNDTAEPITTQNAIHWNSTDFGLSSSLAAPSVDVDYMDCEAVYGTFPTSIESSCTVTACGGDIINWDLNNANGYQQVMTLADENGNEVQYMSAYYWSMGREHYMVPSGTSCGTYTLNQQCNYYTYGNYYGQCVLNTRYAVTDFVIEDYSDYQYDAAFDVMISGINFSFEGHAAENNHSASSTVTGNGIAEGGEDFVWYDF
jgi:hypothetical protein